LFIGKFVRSSFDSMEEYKNLSYLPQNHQLLVTNGTVMHGAVGIIVPTAAGG